MKNWQKIKANPELKRQFLVREKVIDGIRAFFKADGFHEVETPLLVKHPGTEPYLEVFETELRCQNQKPQRGFLLTSPEFAMKKLLSAGFGNIFQICKSFRNEEGLSAFHNPEFTILEWYRSEADYNDIMVDCEQLLLYLNQAINGQDAGTQLNYQGRTYDLSTPWESLTVAEAFEKYAQIDIKTLLSEERIISVGKEKGYEFDNATTWEQAYNQIFLNEIEPHLGKNSPTIIYDYPASQAALSKSKQSDPRFAERYEFYLAGLELGNAFSELIDADEQHRRMLNDVSERHKLDKTDYDIDGDFIAALADGMPEAGGIAVGVDRLVMLFANVPTMKDSLLFPVEDLFDFTAS